MSAVVDVEHSWDQVWRQGVWSISRRTDHYTFEDGSTTSDQECDASCFLIWEDSSRRGLNNAPAFVREAMERIKANG